MAKRVYRIEVKEVRTYVAEYESDTEDEKVAVKEFEDEYFKDCVHYDCLLEPEDTFFELVSVDDAE